MAEINQNLLDLIGRKESCTLMNAALFHIPCPLRARWSVRRTRIRHLIRWTFDIRGNFFRKILP
jgi:hypothetical protein